MFGRWASPLVLTAQSLPAGPQTRVQSGVGTVTAAQPADEQSAPDISQLNPQLQQQWDHAANTHLGNIIVTPFSNRKVQWTCDQCPAVHPHVWLAPVYGRSYGKGCPFCTGRKVCRHNSLPTKAPGVAAQWHPTNNMSQPQNFVAFSHTKAHWLCPACNHTWSASIAHRVLGHGCPNCHVKSKAVKYKRQPSFAACKHPLLAEWDHRRNAEAGYFPERVTLGSNKQVFWLCTACPAGREHSYSAQPNARTRSHIPSGCPQCAGHKACKCNSLRRITLT